MLGSTGLAINPGTPVPPDSLSCDTLWLKSGKMMLVTILSDDGKEIKFSDCPPTEIVSTIPKSSTKLSRRDSILAAQRATMCDTIYLKSGEVLAGHMKYYNSRKVVYTGCCENCITEFQLKRGDVDSIIYVDGKSVGTGTPSDPKDLNNNKVEKVVTPEKEHTPEEQEEARKKSKLFGILGLAAALPITITGVVLFVILAAASNPLIFGLIFFLGAVFGLICALQYVRNRRKAGLSKEKKRN